MIKQLQVQRTVSTGEHFRRGETIVSRRQLFPLITILAIIQIIRVNMKLIKTFRELPTFGPRTRIELQPIEQSTIGNCFSTSRYSFVPRLSRNCTVLNFSFQSRCHLPPKLANTDRQNFYDLDVRVACSWIETFSATIIIA